VQGRSVELAHYPLQLLSTILRVEVEQNG